MGLMKSGRYTFQISFLLLPIKASTLCPRFCGNVSIKYPFGIGDGCYMDKGFEVTCDNGKPYLSSISLELSEGFYYPSYTIGVKFPEVSLNSTVTRGIDLSGSPFSFSTMKNSFISVGCDSYGSGNQNNLNTTACQSFCTCDPNQNVAGCCDVICTLPTNRTFNNTASISNFYSERIGQNCSFAFMVDQEWLQSNYLTNPSVLRGKEPTPARLEWGIYKGTCVELYSSHNTSCNADDYCIIQLSSNHICVCDNQMSDRFQGCTGDLICNTKSGYNCSAKCPAGYTSYSYDSQDTRCYSSRSFTDIWIKKSRVKLFTIIGCCAGLGTLLLVIGIWWLYKLIKRRKAIKLKQKFFKRNGGLLLQQQLSSNEGNIEKTRLFTSKELVKATDNYNANRILGQGGQGTVYKGMLADGKIVAIKKSKVVDESKVEEFINEVVIISQINHRNVVQLLGCCLETEVPILVYEFIPNGTLFQYIHDHNEEFPITWELRRRIAIEVAEALSYLHSAASIPIYHRDIKSTNILLDDKYRAKVSDFGTSRSVTIDQTHLTTQVQGTFGYVDPEYFQSSQFTDKSDVYSFGVVLAELLTGQKPIRSTNDFEEDRSLVTYFLRAMEENSLFKILDARVLKEGEKEEIMSVADVTRRCLNLNGKKRPTMREVAFELVGNIRASNGASVLQQNYDEIDFVDNEITCPYATGSSLSSTGSFLNSVTLDVDPLISKKC
ncbi:putative wall-associated receptor kinase-like 11 [Pistacia vera]|nr:putative wall-associated receptor kinase-like 11 [Pistacia vera]